MAIKQINGEDDYNSSDEEPNFIDAKSKFGVKKLTISKKAVTKQLDEDKVLKAARRVTGAADQSESEEEATKPAQNEEKAPKSIIKQDAKADAKKHQQVVFNVTTDLAGFKTPAKQLIKEDDAVLKNLFVTQEEDALEEFEREKDEEIEKNLGSKVKKPEIRQGWGEWAGEGVDNSKHEQRKQKAEAMRNMKIEELKKKRQDAKMIGVQINETEERDKKFAKKYWVKELPHPFQSAKQFDAVMNMPIGKEWNTSDSYKRLIQNDVLTKAGSIIKPLKFKKDLSLQTIEKLVQHRQSKRANRSAAKF